MLAEQASEEEEEAVGCGGSPLFEWAERRAI
jgi:hypothetical protein